MDHDDPTLPFDGTRGAVRLTAVLGAAALMVGVAAHRHPHGTLEPWRPGPAARLEAPLARQVAGTPQSTRE